MKKISLNNPHPGLYSVPDPVRTLYRLSGAEALVHLLLAGSHVAWNRGFDITPTYNTVHNPLSRVLPIQAAILCCKSFA